MKLFGYNKLFKIVVYHLYPFTCKGLIIKFRGISKKIVLFKLIFMYILEIKNKMKKHHLSYLRMKISIIFSHCHLFHRSCQSQMSRLLPRSHFLLLD